MTQSIFQRVAPDRRRVMAWAMLGLYGLVSSGLPLPVAAPPAVGTPAAATLAGKDRSQPFPCMDKACGCDSAERCFSNCCCHTPAETLAWAKARGIEPAVLAALERRVALAKPAPKPSACCAAPPAVASCCEAEEPAASSCCTAAELSTSADDRICSDYQSLAADPPDSAGDQESPHNEPAAPRVVILRAMLACGGIVAQWAAAGASLPPPAIVTCEIAWPAIGTLAAFDERALGAGSPPDLPPPRA